MVHRSIGKIFSLAGILCFILSGIVLVGRVHADDDTAPIGIKICDGNCPSKANGTCKHYNTCNASENCGCQNPKGFQNCQCAK